MTYSLTKTDIQKLRRASRVTFGTNASGVSTIMARRYTNHISSGHELWTHHIEVSSTRTIYENAQGYDVRFVDAFAHVHHAQGMVWQTIAKLLRPGDQLGLYWSVGGQTTTALQNAGFAGDELTLIVSRPTPGAKKPVTVMNFKVDSVVSDKLSSARMCRVAYHQRAEVA